ncbi:MAG: hypothetical protein ACE5KE_13490 [Methanosarcinales archaeon]
MILHGCVILALEFQGPRSCRALGDSRIIRLHEYLSDLWAAALSKKVAAVLINPAIVKCL